ncbi:MAG: hypothetical protein NVS2B11_11840 [Acetobacteraceae bacterium]
MAKTRPMIARELTPDQLGRLQQIMLRIHGPCAAVMEPESAGQLGLSGPARGQAAAVCQDRMMQMQATFRPPAPGEDPCQAVARNRDVITRIRADSDARVISLFTPGQRDQFSRMLGRDIHLDPPMPPGCAPPRAG